MPTNLKNLLSRSRSRTELKVREEVCSGSDGCQCHGPKPEAPSNLRREVSSRSLFSLPGDESITSEPESPTEGPSLNVSGVPPIRKCETVLALSSHGQTGPSGRVKLMKDRILSTSSSALNSLIHSSSKTTSKLFSGFKLSSGQGQSNGCVNTSAPGSPAGKGGSTASFYEESSIPAPLTPTNRLRRNGSMNKSHAFGAVGSRYGSLTSVGWRDDLPEILCRLCLSSVQLEDTVEIQACSCRYCKDCVTAYVTFEVQEAAYDIACPDATCEKQGVLSLVEIEALVPGPILEKHKKFRLNKDVEKDCQLMWCPSPGCETICKIQEAGSILNGLKSSTPVIQCGRCQHVFCTECKLPVHPEVSCEVYRSKLIRQGKLSLVEEEPFAAYDSIKKCPFCHVPIEKDSGCAQMMCKRCKHVFCWYCLASLDDDFLLRHYDKGPCKNKLGHSRASVVWHRTQVIGIFAGFGLLVLLASPLLILAAPCLLCCKCRYCAHQLDPDDSPASI